MAKAKAKKKDPRQHSPAFQRWLNEPVLKFDDAVYSRQWVVDLTRTPCTRAASNLHHACVKFKIRTLDKLFSTGLDSLSRCANVGERATLIAAFVLHTEGYNVDKWTRIQSKKVLTWPAAVRKAQRAATKRQKHA